MTSDMDRLAEYERRKKVIQERQLPPAKYEKAIDALCEELEI